MPHFSRTDLPGLGAALSRALKAVRRRRGLRPAEAAQAMGMKLRSYEHFEGGRGRPNLERIWRFARALDADPYAILWAMFFDRPEIAVRCMDNKLGLVAAMSVKGLNEAGADLSRIDTRTLLLVFGHAFEELKAAAGRKDEFLTDWMAQRPAEPEPAPAAAPHEGRAAEPAPTASGGD